jgi:hypothetical protein
VARDVFGHIASVGAIAMHRIDAPSTVLILRELLSSAQVLCLLPLHPQLGTCYAYGADSLASSERARTATRRAPSSAATLTGRNDARGDRSPEGGRGAYQCEVAVAVAVATTVNVVRPTRVSPGRTTTGYLRYLQSSTRTGPRSLRPTTSELEFEPMSSGERVHGVAGCLTRVALGHASR